MLICSYHMVICNCLHTSLLHTLYTITNNMIMTTYFGSHGLRQGGLHLNGAICNGVLPTSQTGTCIIHIYIYIYIYTCIHIQTNTSQTNILRVDSPGESAACWSSPLAAKILIESNPEPTCRSIYIYIYIYIHTPVYIYIYIYTYTHIHT